MIPILIIVCLLSTPSETFEEKLKRRVKENRERFNQEYKNMKTIEELTEYAEWVEANAQTLLVSYASQKAMIKNQPFSSTHNEIPFEKFCEATFREYKIIILR